jgi:hypothetical protein
LVLAEASGGASRYLLVKTRKAAIPGLPRQLEIAGEIQYLTPRERLEAWIKRTGLKEGQ